MNRQYMLLDCTLRDGGMALEDAALNKLKNYFFNADMVFNFISKINLSGIDIIELGSIEVTEDTKIQFSIYESIEQASLLIPKYNSSDQMYSVLFRGPDISLSDIPDWHPSLCEVVRVIIRYSEIQKSLDFCRGLAKKGYKVFVQPMVTMRYSQEELNLLINESNDFGAYALYFVDSYGYMTSLDVKNLFEYFDARLDQKICIGFHSHNNMNLAFNNVKTFLNQESNRRLIVDSTVMGMGQGAGNIQTELIVPYMNDAKKCSYNYPSILDACEIIESFMPENLWGYSVTNLLPALNKTAYKYSTVMRHKYKLSYSEIYRLLSTMPEHHRERYTNDAVDEILDFRLKN